MKPTKPTSDRVLGITAPAPCPTVFGAAVLAMLVTCPVAVVIVIIDLIWF